MITTSLIISLLMILVAAWAMGSLFKHLGLPAVLGQLLAGLMLGPAVFGLVRPSPEIELLAELGIFFVMFYTGMELDLDELFTHFWP